MNDASENDASALLYINVADLMDANGRTWRENNFARPHTVPVGALAQLASGVRLFVARHDRDCDGTPLYALCADMAHADDRSCTINGYAEESLMQWWLL